MKGGVSGRVGRGRGVGSGVGGGGGKEARKGGKGNGKGKRGEGEREDGDVLHTEKTWDTSSGYHCAARQTTKPPL